MRSYWTRQWQEIDPQVTPVSINNRSDNVLDVAVHQLIKDRQGQVLTDAMVHHVYVFEDGLITEMNIEHT